MNRSFYSSGDRIELSAKVANDPKLSMKARGLMLTIAGLPDGFDISEASLVDIVPDGKTTVSTAVKELMRNGYLKKSIRRTEDNSAIERGEWDVMI